jgi:hypothetical protein
VGIATAVAGEIDKFFILDDFQNNGLKKLIALGTPSKISECREPFVKGLTLGHF